MSKRPRGTKLDKQEVDLSRICSEDANDFKWKGFYVTWTKYRYGYCSWVANNGHRCYRQMSKEKKKQKDLYRLCHHILNDLIRPV